jgi:hypothetical protein
VETIEQDTVFSYQQFVQIFDSTPLAGYPVVMWTRSKRVFKKFVILQSLSFVG